VSPGVGWGIAIAKAMQYLSINYSEDFALLLYVFGDFNA
jgi:hypothetical protein